MNKARASAWAMDTAEEIIVSEGLAPSAERDLLEKIAAALDAERAAVVAYLRRIFPEWPAGTGGYADVIERGEHRREHRREEME